jgi:L-lactate dehydrogenase complex protein LldE
MVKVLEKAGCTVSYNTRQTCCGQAAFNAGYWEESKSVCQKFIRDFNGTDLIIAPSASCVGFVKNYYGRLFDNSSVHHEVQDIKNRIHEFSSFLVHIMGVTDFGASLPGKATYHDSCAALRECQIKEEPRKLLSKVRGLELREMADVETCCGFGGTFAVKFENISIAMGEQKVENAMATGADYIVSTDLSCLMHQQGYINQKGYSIKTLHLADVLAAGW